jgi:hypothetical protein
MSDTAIDYLLIGHVTADLLATGRRLGGTVSYAAPVAQAFGRRVAILTSAAACEPLLTQLMPYAEITLRVAEETTTFENIYDAQGNRTQYVHEFAAPLVYSAIPLGWLGAPLVHFAPLVDEVDLSMARHFRGSTVMLTLQGLLRQWDASGRVRFKRWWDEDVLRAVDVVVFSKPDIIEAPEIEAEFAQVVKHLIVTDSANGGTYYHNGTPTTYSATPVDEIDPTGAGDVFAASLLASLPHQRKGGIRAAIHTAAYMAAMSVTRGGTATTQAITPDEVQQALQAGSTP